MASQWSSLPFGFGSPAFQAKESRWRPVNQKSPYHPSAQDRVLVAEYWEPLTTPNPRQNPTTVRRPSLRPRPPSKLSSSTRHFSSNRNKANSSPKVSLSNPTVWVTIRCTTTLSRMSPLNPSAIPRSPPRCIAYGAWEPPRERVACAATHVERPFTIKAHLRYTITPYTWRLNTVAPLRGVIWSSAHCAAATDTVPIPIHGCTCPCCAITATRTLFVPIPPQVHLSSRAARTVASHSPALEGHHWASQPPQWTQCFSPLCRVPWCSLPWSQCSQSNQCPHSTEHSCPQQILSALQCHFQPAPSCPPPPTAPP